MADALLITGASTGIGRTCALHLARRGFRVFATVRREADAGALREEAASQGVGPNLEPLLMDVADGATIAAATERLRSILGSAGLRAVVNNAGIGVVGPLEFVSDEDWRKQFEVNVIGAVAVTRACLPMLRAYGDARPGQRRPARIVMMSSIGGRVAQPMLGPYSASKFALEAVSDVLRIELRTSPVGVSVIEPGAVKSEIWRKGDEGASQFLGKPEAERLYKLDIQVMRDAGAKSEAKAVAASRVAVAVERCITARRPPTRVLIGRDARTAAFLKRWLPDRLMDRALLRAFGLPRA